MFIAASNPYMPKPQRGDMFIAHEMPKNLKAPAGRHVYHASASSSESNTYFGCIEQCHRPSFAPTERDMYNGWLFPVFSPSGAECIMDGCFQFLAPAGRHVYSSVSAPEERYVYSSDTLIVRAPEERNVYHASASSSESKHIFWLHRAMSPPVFRPSGAPYV